MVIIIDGLDQAYVSHPSYNIGDYFNTYSENGEIIGDCNYKAETKWILTYREGYYKLPNIVNIYELKKVQPLKGLDEDSIINALIKFKPSKEFLDTVMERGKIL